MLFLTVILLLASGPCQAALEFTYSTIYDIYDFVENEEVPLPRCEVGCVIFASTIDPADDYARNLWIQDTNEERNQSIAEISSWYDDKTQQKIPLTISATANISVINLNAPDAIPSAIVLYVIDKLSIGLFSYKIYDSANMNGLKITTDTAITVMSAVPFMAIANYDTMPNGVTAYLTGFDNAYARNMDACLDAFSIPFTSKFPGFNLQLVVPIISFVFNQRHDHEFTALHQFNEKQPLVTDGFITSGGYIGCYGLKTSTQTFRSPLYKSTEKYLLYSNDEPMKVVSIYYTPNSGAEDFPIVTVNDTTNGVVYTFDGWSTKSISIISTKSIEISFNNIVGNQGFNLQHTAVPYDASTTTAPTTATTTIRSTTLLMTSSTAAQTTTTSGAVQFSRLSFIGAILCVAKMWV